MAVSDRTYLGMPVHQGAYQAALTGYRVADTPDDSGLPQAKKLEAFLAVFNAVHGMAKGGLDTAQADAARVWDGVLSDQQKRMIAATPAAAPMIVAEAMKQDQGLAQKIAARAGRSEAELAAEAAFYDTRGNSPFDKLGAGNAAAFFRKSDYGSMSSQWDPKTGALGLTPANFGSTEFSRVGLDLATTKHLFGLGFGTGNILNAAQSADFLGIGTLNKKGMQHLAAVDKHDPEKEKTIGLAKHYKDALDRDEAYQAVRRRYLAANGAERRALDGEMREIERRHGRATGYEGHVRAAPPGKVRDARTGVQESINEVNRATDEKKKEWRVLASPHASASSHHDRPQRAYDVKAIERILENYRRDPNTPEFRQAYDHLKKSARSPEQKASLARVEAKGAEQTTIENRHGRGNEQKVVQNEKKQEKVGTGNSEGDDLLAGINGPVAGQAQRKTAEAGPEGKADAKDKSRTRAPVAPTGMG